MRTADKPCNVEGHINYYDVLGQRSKAYVCNECPPIGHKGTSNSTFRYSAENPPMPGHTVLVTVVPGRRKLMSVEQGEDAVVPGIYRPLPPSEGLRLCPAREVGWQECVGRRCTCAPHCFVFHCEYCGGKMNSTYFDEYDD